MVYPRLRRKSHNRIELAKNRDGKVEDRKVNLFGILLFIGYFTKYHEESSIFGGTDAERSCISICLDFSSSHPLVLCSLGFAPPS